MSCCFAQEKLFVPSKCWGFVAILVAYLGGKSSTHKIALIYIYMCVCVCVCVRVPTLTYVSTCVSIQHVTGQIFVSFLVLFSKSTGSQAFLFGLGVN